MGKYTCTRCGNQFSQKGHLTAHLARKNRCTETVVRESNLVDAATRSLSKIRDMGQYFTSHPTLRRAVVDLIRNEPHVILEPSVGQGDLVVAARERGIDAAFHMYEIDSTIRPLPSIAGVRIGDFLVAEDDGTRYDTIIGNPPYVRTSGGNLYIDFIDKCHRLLAPGGELIFIVPSEFHKATYSAALMNRMTDTGCFTDMFYPNDEKMFAHASVDVVVFRYCLFDTPPSSSSSPSSTPAVWVTTPTDRSRQYISNNNGVLTLSVSPPIDPVCLSEYFDVHVGLVSGKEGVFKSLLGDTAVLNGPDKSDMYIMPSAYPTGDPTVDAYLLSHKQVLLDRRIRKFSEKNWFEWGAPRNIGVMRTKMGMDCIYVRNITRSPTICFTGKVQLFGGGLIALIPKSDAIDLEKICMAMNRPEFKQNYMYSGRFKIGHKQLANAAVSAAILPE
jgi:adenine-specific DNA-methyltransferase